MREEKTAEKRGSTACEKMEIGWAFIKHLVN